MKVCKDLTWVYSKRFQTDSPCFLVLREIEAEDSLWHQKKSALSKPEEPQEPAKEEKQKQPTQPSQEEESGSAKPETKRKMRFY